MPNAPKLKVPGEDLASKCADAAEPRLSEGAERVIHLQHLGKIAAIADDNGELARQAVCFVPSIGVPCVSPTQRSRIAVRRIDMSLSDNVSNPT
ncbi:hypothetical protein NXC14_PA00140 (plasmid) [Rhizobium sp. NXC14]|nr:hypothetical protein NXC14_PA00140 [Rhizobium sp. NXC14]